MKTMGIKFQKSSDTHHRDDVPGSAVFKTWQVMAESRRTQETTCASWRNAKLASFVMKADSMSSCHSFMRPLLGRCRFGE
jgi:hypothetical protein